MSAPQPDPGTGTVDGLGTVEAVEGVGRAEPPRFDVISIFPSYLDALDLSLVGKARETGLIDLAVHDLRDVTTDRHRTVDDAPFGGGAGMVMRPDVWWSAIEQTAGPAEAADPREVILLVPTPGGTPLTQRAAHALAAEASAGDARLVIACGRYEGIDARVAERAATAPGIRRVQEFSLGDYVLNGGEVAALVLVEAVVRLLPGVLGNPESIAEESFEGDGVLEYPVYTRPAQWEGLGVPEVLTSGHHGAVARWRRERALERTARRRPDLLHALSVPDLSRTDLATLAAEGVEPGPHGRLIGPVRVRRAVPADAPALADLAAATFPLACPDSATLGDVRRHVAEHLSVQVFADYLNDPDEIVLLAHDASEAALGYALVHADGGGADAPEYPGAMAELSKCYVLPRAQGTGCAAELMRAVAEAAAAAGAEAVWLGVNGENHAAMRYYRRHGFEPVGERSYRVGDAVHHDHVLLRALPRTVAE